MVGKGLIMLKNGPGLCPTNRREYIIGERLLLLLKLMNELQLS